MHRINIFAVVGAFLAEVVLDMILSVLLGTAFMFAAISPGMSDADVAKATEAIRDSAAYLTAVVVFGTATTIGGAYLAARIAKTFPYYNGLAIGLVGLAYGLYFWRMNPLWLSVCSSLTVIPVSIFGAHLAKPHLPPAE